MKNSGQRIVDAISREKQLKNWQRAWKNELIEGMNPQWEDLSESIGVRTELVQDIEEIAGQARNDDVRGRNDESTNPLVDRPIRHDEGSTRNDDGHLNRHDDYRSRHVGYSASHAEQPTRHAGLDPASQSAEQTSE